MTLKELRKKKVYLDYQSYQDYIEWQQAVRDNSIAYEGRKKRKRRVTPETIKRLKKLRQEYGLGEYRNRQGNKGVSEDAPNLGQSYRVMRGIGRGLKRFGESVRDYLPQIPGLGGGSLVGVGPPDRKKLPAPPPMPGVNLGQVSGILRGFGAPLPFGGQQGFGMPSQSRRRVPAGYASGSSSSA